MGIKENTCEVENLFEHYILSKSLCFFWVSVQNVENHVLLTLELV